ncbi:MAG TPA: TetR/AcrR family transcriptional regulator [Acidimicrobiales bacterium]
MSTSRASVSARKSRVAAIARSMFAERGYDATTMRDLGDACGLLPGSLYAHFRNKADLARYIVMEFFDDLLPQQEAVYNADGSGAERFALMIDHVYAVCERHHEAVRMLHYDWNVLSKLDEFADVRAATDRALDLWRDTAAEGIKDGSIDPDLDPEHLMRIANSVVVRMMDPTSFGIREQPTSALSAVEHIKRCLLMGIVTKAGARKVQRHIQRLSPPAPERQPRAKRGARGARRVSR